MSSRPSARASRFVSRLALASFALALSAVLFAGCGTSSTILPPVPGGNASVTVLMTSTANDRLVRFDIKLNSLALVDEAGNSFTLLSNAASSGPGTAEFMHLSGAVEPLVTVSVPQGVYTSAIAELGACSITNVFVGSTGSLTQATSAEGLCAQGAGKGVVNLADPITISGSATTLSLNLQVSDSFTLDMSTSPATFTISPVFSLTPVTISAQPTNDANGKITGLDAQITSVNQAGASFIAQVPNGASINLNSNASTVFQGVTAVSELTVGTLVNMDAAFQSDGSLLATRVEVDDPTSPTRLAGFWETPVSPANDLPMIPFYNQGCVPGNCGSVYFSTNTTVFDVSRQFSNVPSLPFAASFTSTNLVPGQLFGVFSPNVITNQGAAITTLTLRPQTINGTITSVSDSGGFTVYTVALAPYDMIPTVQGNLAAPTVTNPTTVVVYADTTAQLLNSSPAGAGSLLRFRGLIFNDNGTLRMDCSAVLDGIAE